MCFESYLKLTENPLTEKSKLIQLETRNNTQAHIIGDVIREKNKAKKEYEKQTQTIKANLKNHYNQKLRNLKQENLKIIKALEKRKQEINTLKQQNNKKITSPVPKKRKEKVLKRDGYRCLCCGTTKNLTVDHVIPRAKGGNNRSKNLQTLCFNCNQAKGVKIIDYRKVKPLMVREAK